jgi:hypothetical protein
VIVLAIPKSNHAGCPYHTSGVNRPSLAASHAHSDPQRPGGLPMGVSSSPLALAPLPALLFAPGRPQPLASSSTPPGGPSLRPPIPPRLPLASVVAAGVSLVVLDRVAGHYADAGVGPAWPLLGSAAGFYVFLLLAWGLLVGSLPRSHPASRA